MSHPDPTIEGYCYSCEQIAAGDRCTHNSWPCSNCGYFNSPLRFDCSRCGRYYLSMYDPEKECPYA